MPATFLTPASYAELLLPTTRDRDDVDLLAERAELMVLDYYTETTQRYGDLQRDVMLDGYDTDLTKIDKDLLRRLRITIALVTEHVVSQMGVDPRLRLMVRGPRTVSYAGVFRTLPHGWNSALQPYDLTTPCYSI